MNVNPSHGLESSNKKPSLGVLSFYHFQKEIREKDPNSATFGAGFKIFRVINPIFCDETLWFQVVWRHKNFCGVDFLESDLVYKLCPVEAMKFYKKRYNKKTNK